MKIFRYLLLAVLFLGYRGMAHAYAVIINDPSSFTMTPFDVEPGVPFSFNFVACNVTVDNMHMTGCAEGINDSNVTLTNIVLNYSDVLGGSPVCSSNAFDNLICPTTPSGGQFVLSFGDHPSDDNGCDGDDDSDDHSAPGTGIAPGCGIYFYENQTTTDGPPFPTVHGIANTPEPGSIWLALSGLGSAGYLIRRRRKNPTV